MFGYPLGVLAALVMFGISVIAGFYNAGKYHNGGKDVREGDEAAKVSALSAIIALVIFVLLFLGV